MEGSIATRVLYVPPFPIHVTAALAANGPPPPASAAVAVADSAFAPTDNAVASGGNTTSSVAFVRSRSVQLLPPSPAPLFPSFLPSFLSSFFPPSPSIAIGPPSVAVGRKQGSAIISYSSGLSVEFPHSIHHMMHLHHIQGEQCQFLSGMPILEQHFTKPGD